MNRQKTLQIKCLKGIKVKAQGEAQRNPVKTATTFLKALKERNVDTAARSRANFSRAGFLCVCDALVGRLMYLQRPSFKKWRSKR